MFSSMIIIGFLGCSGGGNVPTSPEIGQEFTVKTIQHSHTATACLGYYDIYYDIPNREFEAVFNRNASFTLNIVPFLNLMTSPPNGITFGTIIVHDDDPEYLGIDVEFQIHHPFPTLDQYKAYDLIGVVIGDGTDFMTYDNLRVAQPGRDMTMKNADGFTRWFNPSEFTTELIFGWAPGGFQNMEGNAHLNPYKYYAQDLEPDGDLWEFLTGDSNNDGYFQTGIGRMMELEFPMPPTGIGLRFGYAVICCWEEQGVDPPGGYTPYHRDEAIAASVSVTPDLYWNEIESGGDLIVDIDLYAWKAQPSTVKIESSVLANVEEFDFETYALPGGENYSTWHIEQEADNLTSDEGNYLWLIAESEAYDYVNLEGVPAADATLAAFWRYELAVAGESTCPDVYVTGVDFDPPHGQSNPTPEPYVGLEIYGEGFDGTTGLTVEFQGNDPVPVTNVVSNDEDTITCDADFSATQPGHLYMVYVINECGNTITSAFYVEVKCAEAEVTGIDFDPPNLIEDPPPAEFFGVEIYGSYFGDPTGLTVEFVGNDPVTVTNIDTNGSDVITLDADFSATTIGDKYDLYIKRDCNEGVTYDDFVEIVPAIIPWGGVPGPGIHTLEPTIAGAHALDIAVMGEIMEINLTGDNTVVDTDLSGACMVIYEVSSTEVLIDHISPDLSMVLDTNGISGISGVTVEYGSTVIACAKGNQTEDVYEWREGCSGMIGPDVYFFGHASLEDLQLWYDWGTGPAPGMDATCESLTDLTGMEYSFAAGHSRGIWGTLACTFHKYVPTYGTDGNFSLIASGDLNFDGAMDGKLIALGVGGTNFVPYEPIGWCAHVDSPHLKRYSNSEFTEMHSSGITAGPEGTGEGEVHNPLDITIANASNRLYVLDEPSAGITRIQCFDAKTGDYVARSLNYDMSAEGGGTPYRIDSNEYEDVIVVLYDNNTCQVFKDFSI